MLEMYCLQILILDFMWSTLIKLGNWEVTGYVLKWENDIALISIVLAKNLLRWMNCTNFLREESWQGKEDNFNTNIPQHVGNGACILYGGKAQVGTWETLLHLSKSKHCSSMIIWWIISSKRNSKLKNIVIDRPFRKKQICREMAEKNSWVAGCRDERNQTKSFKIDYIIRGWLLEWNKNNYSTRGGRCSFCSLPIWGNYCWVWKDEYKSQNTSPEHSRHCGLWYLLGQNWGHSGGRKKEIRNRHSNKTCKGVSSENLQQIQLGLQWRYYYTWNSNDSGQRLQGCNKSDSLEH